MVAQIYRTGTEYVWVPITQVRGELEGTDTAGLFFSSDPNVEPPAVAAFTQAVLALAGEENPLSDEEGGQDWIALLVGPDGQETLTQGDHQTFTLIDTGSEKIIRLAGVVTVL